jgi:cation:H+ antiporter
MLLVVGFCAALGAILLGAHLFTAGVEHLGRAWGLGRGVMGNLLAAVGTALPESLLPLVAFIWGGQVGVEVGVGAILGAPLMLSTLAMGLVGATALLRPRDRRAPARPDQPAQARGVAVRPDPAGVRRDLQFFLVAGLMVLGVALYPEPWVRTTGAAALVLWYIGYVLRTVGQGGSGGARVYSISAWGGIWRLMGGLAIMVLAAHQFVTLLELIAHRVGISAFVIATLLAPVATELPEKFASVLWILRGDDDLAVGNVTGAMVFQSTLIPALGMLLTPWVFGPAEYLALVAAMAGGFYLRAIHRIRTGFAPVLLLLGIGIYATWFWLTLGHV